MNLIGRDAERVEVGRRLDSSRLVTIVGPGGVGKTALATAVGAGIADRFDQGTLHIDLTRIDDDGDVGSAIAAQLGLPSFAALIDSPVEPSALLVVDNCEHVIDTAAAAIDELLEACAAPTVLATSRLPLDLPGETIFKLEPLATPAAPDGDNPCIRLLRERAEAAGATVGDDTDLLAVLARRLEGVPLALELAAARLRSLSLPELISMLDAQLDLLDRPRYRGAERHRGLRATIDWSYRLLGDGERDLLDRLGMLAGPFTTEMAHRICGDQQRAIVATSSVLDGLAASSLLTVDSSSSPTRYRMFEAVRSYTAERLSGDERDELHERLVDFVVDQLIEISGRSRTGWDGDIIVDLLDLFDNAATAVRWCVTHDEEPTRALLIVAVLWGVVHQARTAEVADLGRTVLDRWPRESSPFWSDAAATTATCRYLLGDPAGAVELVHEALPRAGRSRFAPVTLRRVLAQSTQALGRTDEAIAIFVEAAELAERAGLAALEIELEADIAQLTALEGRLDDALGRVREVLERTTAPTTDISVLWANTVEANILRIQGSPDAKLLVDQTLRRCLETQYPAGIILNLRAAALLAIERDDVEEATACLHRLLDEMVRRGAINELRIGMAPIVAVLELAGRTDRVADLVATWAQLPVVSMIASATDLPPTSGTVLERSEAIRVARHELRAVDMAGSGPLSRTEPASTVPTTQANQPSRATPWFVLSGDVWDVGFRGRTARFRVSKGMLDLARLLESPGREIHALDLIGAGSQQPGAGPALDDAAKQAYEERIRELQADEDEAIEHNDPARAELARTELDALVDQLAAALGLAGRDRTTGSDAERARSAVTQRLRGTIRRITDTHPPLGLHLRNAIRTGIYCSYQPDEELDWEVQLT